MRRCCCLHAHLFRIVSVPLALCLPCGLSGCPDNGAPTSATTPASRPFEGSAITLSTPAGLGFASDWDGPLAEWSVQAGAEAKLIERESDDDLPSQLKTGKTSLGVFAFERLGDLLADRSLAAIPDAIARDAEGIDWPDLLPGLRDAMPAQDRRPLVVPLACPVLLCYYREDLLQQAQLAPPQTWDDYHKLVESLGDWAPGLSAVEPCSESFLATLFLARAVAYAKHPGRFSVFFDIDNGAPLIDSPAFVRALDMAASSWNRMPAEIRGYSPAGCRKQILEGKAALAIAFESSAIDAGKMSAVEPRSEPAVVGFCRLPGVREYYNPTQTTWERPNDKGVHFVTLAGFGGWGVGVSSAAKPTELEAAWNAIGHLGDGSFVAGFPQTVVGFCRESQVGDSGLIDVSAWRGDEASGCLEAIAAGLRDRRIVLELPVPRRQEFLAALRRALQRVLAAEASSEEALQQVAREWQALVKSIGAERLRDTYRLSLGLAPK